MAASPEQARINGRKGGRPKGLNAINAEKGKAILIQAYLDNIRPINDALLKKAIEGDIQAIKELHDRVYGKSYQAITGLDGGPIKVETITGMEIINDKQ